MANTTIPQLPLAVGLDGSEQLQIVQGGTSKRTTVGAISGGSGSVTSVNVSGGSTGLTTSGGPVTSSGSITIGGTLAVTSGGTNATTAAGARVNILPSYTGNASKVLAVNSGATDVEWVTAGNGTVTSVAALTLGTAGTDLSSTVANGTTTPVITLNVPTASASNRGALNSTDWSTFNSKQASLVSGTNIKTVGGASLLGSGDVGTIGVGYGGTGVTGTPTNGQLLIGNGTGFTLASLTAGTNITITPSAGGITIASAGGGSMIYPGAGIANSTGSAWGTSYSTSGSGTALALTTSPTFITPALGTPASGVVTNLTGTASININGTVGSTTPTTGAFTTLTSPLVIGGSAVSSPLTLQSTSAAGATDYIAFKTGSQVERMRISNAGGVSIGTSVDAGAKNILVDSAVKLTSGSFVTSLQGSGSAAASSTYTLPVSAPGTTGYVLSSTTGGVMSWVANGGGSMVYPSSSGIVYYDGTGWGASYTTTGTGTVVALANAPTFTSSIISPLVNGGTGAASNLVLQSTSGTGTSDYIAFNTGSQVERMRIDTNGRFGFGTSTTNAFATFTAPTTSAAAWTNTGINLIQKASTFTDTSSTGTVASIRINSFDAQTLAASSTLTVTDLYGTYFTAPNAGTNVTGTNKYSIGSEGINNTGTLIQVGSSTFLGSFSVNNTTTNVLFGSLTSGTWTAGGTSGTGTITLGRSTVSQQTDIQAGITASGSTKTINIGTGAASGATSTIAVGSTTLGATQTTTVNGRVTLAPIGASVAAWGASGIALVQSAATFTDTTTPIGTIADVRMNVFGAQTFAATNALTATIIYGNYFADPVAGTNVTNTVKYALGSDSLRVVNAAVLAGTTTASAAFTLSTTTLNIALGTSQTTGILTLGNTAGTGTITLGQSTVSQTTNIQAGATASGSTKAINIGTNGGSGSNTQITLGAAAGNSNVNLSSNTTLTFISNGFNTSLQGSVSASQNVAYSLPAAAPAVTGYVLSSTTGGVMSWVANGGGSMVYPGAGIAVSTGSAWTTSLSAPSSTIVGISDTQTLTNKTVTQRAVAAAATTGNITPNSDTTDLYLALGLTGTTNFQIPSGSPTNGQKLTIRIKDNGTARSLTWVTSAGGYRIIGTTLPTTTVASKTIYVGCVYNTADAFWDVVAVSTEL
jgi:hypothetical protein